MKPVNRNQPVGSEASTKVGNVQPLGHVCRWKKKKENAPREGRPLGCKARTGSTTGDPWGQVQSSKKTTGQAGTDGELGSQSGVDGMEPQGLSTGSRWSTTCKLNTVIRYVGPMRAVNMMPVVGNVEPYYFRWHLQELSMGRQWSTT